MRAHASLTFPPGFIIEEPMITILSDYFLPLSLRHDHVRNKQTWTLPPGKRAGGGGRRDHFFSAVDERLSDVFLIDDLVRMIPSHYFPDWL